MLTNYHTHTTRCGHAEGTEEEYILTALRCGFKVLGFSDHTPWAYATQYPTQTKAVEVSAALGSA